MGVSFNHRLLRSSARHRACSLGHLALRPRPLRLTTHTVSLIDHRQSITHRPSVRAASTPALSATHGPPSLIASRKPSAPPLGDLQALPPAGPASDALNFLDSSPRSLFLPWTFTRYVPVPLLQAALINPPARLMLIARAPSSSRLQCSNLLPPASDAALDAAIRIPGPAAQLALARRKQRLGRRRYGPVCPSAHALTLKHIPTHLSRLLPRAGATPGNAFSRHELYPEAVRVRALTDLQTPPKPMHMHHTSPALILRLSPKELDATGS
ncbi:hypothetical protein C8R47DRAFT_1228693 [Mycena vitilis]|nr:hypothetical protein C8R47DRAFT_1228693 [Mycena vitilis]